VKYKKALIQIFFIIFQTGFLYAQENEQYNGFKNSISFDYFYYRSYIIESPSFGNRNSIFTINYKRNVFTTYPFGKLHLQDSGQEFVETVGRVIGN